MSHCTGSSLGSLLLSSQDSVDAVVDQAVIPPSIFAPEDTHGGYGTWQLMMSEEGFQAAQNVYWWHPSDESAATSVYLVCHPVHLCASGVNTGTHFVFIIYFSFYLRSYY